MNHVSMESVQVFVAVASRGSIVGAAEALGYTPSAISQRLSGLERELGVTLFERLGNRLKISDKGAALIPAATEILRAAENLVLAATSDIDDFGIIRIGGFPSGLSLLARNVLGPLSKQGCETRLTSVEDSKGMRDLRSGVLDVMLIQEYGSATRQASDVVYTTVCVEPLLLVCGTPRPSIKSASTGQWVIPGERTVCGSGVRTICRSAGFEPDIVADVDDFGLIVDLVASNHIYAILPSSAVPTDSEGLHYTSIKNHERKIIAAHRTTKQTNHAVAMFLSETTKALSN